MTTYYRPIIQNDNSKPNFCFHVGNQRQWFDKVEIIERSKDPIVVSANEIPRQALKEITYIRSSDRVKSSTKPLIMGILNITPDSFSDGGKYIESSKAISAAETLIMEGADILDIGGESTRPGAKEVSEELEFKRIEPVIKEIKGNYPQCRVSVDTRKSYVMKRVIDLGVDFINDVSAISFDQKSRDVLATRDIQVCLMHGGVNPETMQENIFYEDVLLDVYDYLKSRINFSIAGGIKKENILVDPGIGFGKTIDQNISLIRKASLFHSLGCPILYGVSRKSFIGHLGCAPDVMKRFPGSIASAIELIRQGIQVIRVHDVKETKQALDLWEAIAYSHDRVGKEE